MPPWRMPTPDRPRVDVGIVSWNTRDLTVQAIDRLLASSADVDLHVLLRDNGSDDGTATEVRLRFPEVEVEVGENVGFAAGVNALVRRSTAPWFVTLNSDAWPEPGALGQLVRVAVGQPRAAVVAPLLLRPDGAREASAHPLPSLVVAAIGSFGLARLLPKATADRLCLPPGWDHQTERPVGWAVGAALLLRRSALDELGPLDESFFMYAEDLEWCWRAHQSGWQTWFTPTAVVRHVGNASGEQRYGNSRDQVVIANANVVVRRFLGRRVVVWRFLNALGAVRLALGAGLRGRRGLAAHWWRQVPAHLGHGRGGS
ncbi:MAG: glycosyl transferase family 2 [Frankiales bacterium]|nr:glycosyl transferase family 2 [Frankiales bacterium]